MAALVSFQELLTPLILKIVEQGKCITTVQ